MFSAKALASIGLLLLLTLTGCDRSSEPLSNHSAVDKTITIELAAIPARYEAPLPTTVAGLQSWLKGDAAIAPVSHVVENILHGDKIWMMRLSIAAGAVSDTERLAWARKWHDLFEFESVGASFCAQARTIMSAPPATIRAVISGPFARSCAKTEDAPMVLRADTPYWAVLEYFDPWSGGGDFEKRRPFDPRLVAAAREVILNHSDLEARSAVFVLAEQQDPRADAAIQLIYSEVKDQVRADEVAKAFADARGLDELTVAKCGFSQASSHEKRVPVSAVKARIEQLSAMGFTKVKKLNVAELNTDSTEEILLAAGYAHWFDVETGQYPNQHDSLMRSLALLVTPELDDAIFEERAPAMDNESEPYQLLVYSGGKLYRATAENLGDWYDTDAVLRLMNAVMEDRKVDIVFTNLAATDQSMTIVAAPPATIEKAVDDGLLELGDAGEAERIGKGFEERVLNSLK